MLCGALRALHCASQAAIAQVCCVAAENTLQKALSAMPGPLCPYSSNSAWSTCSRIHSTRLRRSCNCTFSLIQQPGTGVAPISSSSPASACFCMGAWGGGSSTCHSNAASPDTFWCTSATCSTAAGGERAKPGSKARTQEQKVGCHPSRARALTNTSSISHYKACRISTEGRLFTAPTVKSLL